MVLLRPITGFVCLCLSAVGRAQTPTLKASLHHTFKAHSAPPRQLAFSPDSKTLATSGVDSVVKLWSLADGKLVRTLVHPEGVTSIAFSRDGQWLVSGSYDNAVRVWRVADGSLVRTLKGHTRPVWTVDVSPDGQRIASGGEDKTVRLWRLSDGSPLRTLTGHTLNVWQVAFSADGQRVASGRFDKTVRIWRTETGNLERILSGHEQAVVGIAFSPDGRWLASGGREKGAIGTFWKQIVGNRPGLRGSDGPSVRLWRLRDGALQEPLNGYLGDVSSVAFSPDGRWLATTSEDGTVKLWRLARG